MCWQGLVKHIPKTLRYSLALRIEGLFAEMLECISLAYFSSQEYRGAYIGKAIAKNDTLKFMLYALYELRGISMAQFAEVSQKAEEVGKMLYGWKNKLLSENRPAGAPDVPKGAPRGGNKND